MSSADTPVIFIVGPTAVGKSALALHLARAFNGEIVNADSRQVYRFMDIGTAKPPPQDRARVPHHLINILDPDQDFSLALFLDLAHRAIRGISGRRKVPIVTGGTGQYIWALAEGWQPPRAPANPKLRHELEQKAEREGAESLYRMLRERDPQTAARIDPLNVRRVIRALEIHDATGTSPSAGRRKQPPPYRGLIIGLTMDRKELYLKIDRRVDEMLERGLEEEVGELLRTGYSSDLPSMSSIGYREIGRYLRGELTLKEASQRIKYETHRFARRQYAWFRLDDPRIHWLEAGANLYLQAESLVEGFLREGGSYGTIPSATQEKPR